MATQGLNTEGVRLHQQGDYQAAGQRFMKAITNDPANADGYYNLAATYHRVARQTGSENDYAQAENFYNQCLDRDMNHVDCYRGLAVLLSETQRPDASQRLLEGWVSRSPQLADAKIELARLKQELGDRYQAEQYLLSALTQEPDNPRALTALASLREASGDHAQALANYQRSLGLNRFQPEVASRIASLRSAVRSAPLSASQSDTRFAAQPTNWSRY
ncbi:MAG: tetratricopeptide repeat protein [Planctomycetales bacterium]|nr:tetratricopeptide repeat protein [Planctomycetales bacterium]